jgi:two-component system response regulator MprA
MVSRSILIVDDDPGVRQVLERVLRDEGFVVECAANGYQALDRIAAHPPDVVLLDLQMPVMSGWSVLRQLRRTCQQVPVVLMTAGYRAAGEAEQNDVAGFLAKPFDNLEQIVEAVERAAACS